MNNKSKLIDRFEAKSADIMELIAHCEIQRLTIIDLLHVIKRIYHGQYSILAIKILLIDYGVISKDD
jgi:hypothetical protein